MLKNITAPGIILFGVIPLRFLIEWTPLLGIPYLSTFCILVQYLAMLSCLLKASSTHGALRLTKLTKWSIGIFVLYSMYLVYDIVLNPQLPRVAMEHTPESNVSLFQSIISFYLIFILVNYCNMKIDYIRWAKFSCLFLSIMLIVYVLRVDFSYYILIKTVNPSTGENDFSLSDVGMFDSLRLGMYCGITYVCNLFLKNMWSENNILCKGLFWGITILSVSICMATIQRGPIIFIISTTLFYYYAKGIIRHHFFRWIVFVAIVFWIFSDFILELLFNIAPDLMERFADIAEGGSGRYGSKDSAYSLAYKEIMLNPVWGHYFRYTMARGYFYGHYPHNIFLESLMTMGIIGSIPFFYILYRCVKNAYYAIKDDAPIAVVGLIFIYIFSSLVTSHTMVQLGVFWIPLVFISAYIPQKNRL